jgi:hypothetical protein
MAYKSEGRVLSSFPNATHFGTASDFDRRYIYALAHVNGPFLCRLAILGWHSLYLIALCSEMRCHVRVIA